MCIYGRIISKISWKNETILPLSKESCMLTYIDSARILNSRHSTRVQGSPQWHPCSPAVLAKSFCVH